MLRNLSGSSESAGAVTDIHAFSGRGRARGRSAAAPTAASQISPDSWRDLCEQFPPGVSSWEIDEALKRFAELSEDDRAAVWLYSWARLWRR
jgi:NAD-dependent oxidoreductase involved in siderophore biosynthesis